MIFPTTMTLTVVRITSTKYQVTGSKATVIIAMGSIRNHRNDLQFQQNAGKTDCQDKNADKPGHCALEDRCHTLSKGRALELNATAPRRNHGHLGRAMTYGNTYLQLKIVSKFKPCASNTENAITACRSMRQHPVSCACKVRRAEKDCSSRALWLLCGLYG